MRGSPSLDEYKLATYKNTILNFEQPDKLKTPTMNKMHVTSPKLYKFVFRFRSK